MNQSEIGSYKLLQLPITNIHFADKAPKRLYPALLIVVFVYQVNHNFYHDVLFFCSALSNHQRERNKGAICYALAPVRMIEDVVAVEKPKKQRGGNALVAIAERVVLGNKVE